MKPTFYAKPYTPTIPGLSLPLAPMPRERSAEDRAKAQAAMETSGGVGDATTAQTPRETPAQSPAPPVVEPPMSIPLASQTPQTKPSTPIVPPAPPTPPAAPKRPAPALAPQPQAEVDSEPLKLPRVAPPQPRRDTKPKTKPALEAQPEPQPAAPDTLGLRRIAIVGRVVAAVITLAMIGIIARVYQLQTDPAPQLASLINAKYSTQELLGRRAPLLDREGRILAVTGIAHRLYVDPHRVADLSSFPETLGYTMGYDPAFVARRMYSPPDPVTGRARDRRYVVIDQKLSEEQWSKLERFRLAGMYTDVWLDRHYPMGPVAGHVIGFVGQEGQGFEGAERIFDRQLLGEAGKMTYLRDAGRRPLQIDADRYQHARDGQPVKLSIDITIQAIAEAELAKQCQEFGAKTGELIVMDPNTGEILAMANYPTFDPNEFATTPAEVRRNRCVTDPFEPGSTFKPFIWAMAVEGGFAKPSDMINTDQPLGRALRDTHAHGTLSWEQVLVKSSNRGMAVVGIRMGIHKLFTAVKGFGFGDLTRSNMPGESKGLVHDERRWNPTFSVTSVPMGQEVSVTPLQLARGFCVFANDGRLPTPTLRAIDPMNPADPHSIAISERVISARTAQITRDAMRKVVTEGTGRKADSKLYEIFGKTGTAQVASSTGRGYEPNAYTGTFVAGAPYDNPRLVIACVIHKPDVRKGYYGGIVAAPAAMRVFERTLAYMGVKPKSAEENQTALAGR
ncbi:MAG: penicillin-binding transpeptidase domain-containing protein [Phycisphaeraceae bacterium]